MRHAWLIATLAAALLAGCTGNGNTFVNSPGVRAFNAVLADPVATVNDGSTNIATDLTYATESGVTRSPYVITTTGPQTATFMYGGATFATASFSLLSTESVNLIATPNNSDSVIVLVDNTGVPSDSEVRIVNAASSTNVPSADVVFTPASGGTSTTYTVATNAVLPTQPAAPSFAYNVLPSANYVVQVFPTGQDNGAPLLKESVNLVSGQRWTFVVVDSNDASSKIELAQIQDNLELTNDLARPTPGSLKGTRKLQNVGTGR